MCNEIMFHGFDILHLIVIEKTIAIYFRLQFAAEISHIICRKKGTNSRLKIGRKIRATAKGETLSK